MHSETKLLNHLPLTGRLTRAFVVSLVVGVVTAVTTLISLIFQNTIYSTTELRQSFVPNDILNLIIGLPILLAAMWLARRGRLVGLLLWPGALLYGLYNYVAYIFGLSFGVMTVVYLAIVLLSAYAVFDLFKNIDAKSVQAQIADAIPVKTSGWILLLFGAAFILRAMGMIVDAGLNQTVIPAAEFGTLIADIVLALLFLAGGVLLLRQRPLGYVGGLGLLFAASMLFVGLIAFLLLQPVLTAVPFVPIDVIVVTVMGLVCFIPFGLFVRGVVGRKLNQTPGRAE
jgi:hypothetical protein